MQPADLSSGAKQVVRAAIGDNIDRATLIELRGAGVIPPLYEAARTQVGSALSMAAAELVRKQASDGGTALILTGFPIMPYELAETDGPTGAAAVARSLNVAYGVLPVLLAEEEYLPCIRESCRAAGLIVFDDPAKVRGQKGAVVLGFTKDKSIARLAAEKLVEKLQPVIGIAVERTGWNSKEEHHSGRGVNLSRLTAKLDHVFNVLAENGVPTIGIGDLGNELGMGSLRETVERITASGKRCACPCESGMAAIVPSDVPVVAAVSNWGAMGLCAALAYLEGRDEILHSPDTEADMLRACVAAGAIDGPTGRPIPWVDGIETGYHLRLVQLLHDIINYPSRLYAPYRASYEWTASLRGAS